MEKMLRTRKTSKKPEPITINKAVRARKTGKKSVANGEDRSQLVAVAAYYLAEKRGFAPGQELEDWFRAESMIDSGALQEEKRQSL